MQPMRRLIADTYKHIRQTRRAAEKALRKNRRMSRRIRRRTTVRAFLLETVFSSMQAAEHMLRIVDLFLGRRKRPRSGRKAKRIRIPPGHHLRSFARIVFGKKKAERVFDQIISEMRDEYFEAQVAGQRLEAFFARLRGLWVYLKAAVKASPTLVRLAGKVLQRIVGS